MTGAVYPALADVALVEFDGKGIALQSASPSDVAGSFTLPQPFSGQRIEALSGGSDWRVPLVRSARVRHSSAPVEVNALTTLFDQLIDAGQSPDEARDVTESLIEGACGPEAAAAAVKALYADTRLSSSQREGLLRALEAYLDAFRHIGMSAKTLGMPWAERVSGRQQLLARMCSVASTILSDAWLVEARRSIAADLGTTADDRRLDAVAELRAQAASDVLGMIGLTLVDLEYPGLNLPAAAQRASRQGQEADLAVRLVESRLLDAVTAGRQSASSASPGRNGIGVEIDAAGRVLRSITGRSSGSLEPAPLRFSNEAEQDRVVRLSVGGTELAELDGVLLQVLAMPSIAPDEPVWQRAWRYVASHRRHRAPISGGRFLHQPDLYLRSIASGFCDDVASVLHWIWRAFGLEARVIGLGGHVVPEVAVGGRWEVYDPDLGLYFINRSGVTASVDDLATDPDLLLHPLRPMPRLNPTSDYDAELVAKIYASLDNNAAQAWFSVASPDPLGAAFSIPVGGYLEIEGAATRIVPTTNAGYSVDLVPVRLWFPPGYSGTVELPLILVDLAGDGQASLIGNSFDLTLDGMASTILDYYRGDPDVGIARIALERVGPGGVTLTMVANPLLVGTNKGLTAKILGADLSGVSVAEVPAGHR